jgi:hypothetical protein
MTASVSVSYSKYWSDGPLTYALAAPVEQGYLRELGARLYPHPD